MEALRTANAIERLRLAAQADLSVWPEVALGERLWSVQRRIAQALSRPRAQVVVPSCTASGKSFLAARVALAFFDVFAPGTPCVVCGGPCSGSKVITTSAKEDQLKLVLWGEIRRAYAKLAVTGYPLPGQLKPADMALIGTSQHYLVGQVARTAESLQGHHAAHVLVVVDEGAAIGEETAHGITTVLSSGDARLLVILNPTTDDTWAARLTRSDEVETIHISVWDTPHFTGEPVPPDAHLVDQKWLDQLVANGQGPGTYDWTTRVEGKFWSATETQLVHGAWYDAACRRDPVLEGVKVIGIDLASYGNAENVLAYRHGSTLERVSAYPSMRMDHFWEGPVFDACHSYEPDVVVYDADGVGAGCIGYAERLRSRLKAAGRKVPQVVTFRGGLKSGRQFRNIRSARWWSLRQRFERGEIIVAVRDEKLRSQLTGIQYKFTEKGAIRVESKDDMRRRGLESPDRADAVMYAFAYDAPLPSVGPPNREVEAQLPQDRSEPAFWERLLRRLDRPKRRIHPILGIPDW